MEKDEAQRILDWCTLVLGRCELVSGDLRFHGRTAVWRLRTDAMHCYAKIHRERSYWEAEAHGYERWASAFGSAVPQLLALHEDEPPALIISDLPGITLDQATLTPQERRLAWRDAGRALAPLHEYAVGECFGPCGRDGVCIGSPMSDAREYIWADLEHNAVRGARAGYLDDDELAVVRAAQERVEVFAGERPVPCHRDYCPVNWLVSTDGKWSGVIDFEFAHWDVRVADFSRYPDWEWIREPELLDAFLEGYGQPLTAEEEQQCLIARTRYALGAIVWGHEASFHGFVEEGRQALGHLAPLLR